MTTPMVETVRTIPLIIEKDYELMDAESGFPFDHEDRDDFRTQLDDIAQRHPEFAQHLEGFPFRSDRRPPRASDQEFRRFTDRPFGSGRFTGFPFNDDPFEETQPEQPPPEEKPKQERSRKPNNIQPSNTVDLGQKQEPVNDRSQRSMSAPPDNRQRYVSSIHIPINPEGGMGDMGKAQSQPQEKPANKPTERVIPIHVEGRDEPVIPKHAGASFTQAQPERIFGHSPSQFTQYVGREPPRQFQGFGPKEPERQVPVQKVQPQQQQPPQQKKEAPPQQPPQQKEEAPPQQPPKPESPQPQPPKSNNPIDIIQAIQRDVGELMEQVEKFTGMPRDKQYLYLDEMLTRNLLKLDNIDTQGQENIRQARKEAIKCIESCINILEAKAAANVPKEQVKSDESQPTPQADESQEKMEVETPKPEETPVEVAPQPTSEEKMEVAPQATAPPEEIKAADEEMKESENKVTTENETENVNK